MRGTPQRRADWGVRSAVVTFGVLIIATAACVAEDTAATQYRDVAALAAGLHDAGIDCDLEYEGLQDGDREVSTCTIHNEFALLQVWLDPALLAEFLAEAEVTAGARVQGGNWLIELESAETADAVATALGGSVDTPAP